MPTPFERGLQQGQDVARARATREAARRTRTASRIADPGSEAFVGTTQTRSAGPLLLAEGDSWFMYPGKDILQVLDDDGFDIESVAKAGDRLESMAYDEAQAVQFSRMIGRVKRRTDLTPRAVLVSGGGNDIAGPELAMLLDHRSSGRSGLNKSVVRGVVRERLHAAYSHLIGRIHGVCLSEFKVPVPIILHGYAHPVPDGRGFLGGFWLLPGPWLEPSLRQKGYDPLTEGRALLGELIDEFNGMLRTLAATTSAVRVHYVDVRDVLSPAPSGYTQDWQDELHPTGTGFEKVARRIATVVDTLP